MGRSKPYDGDYNCGFTLYFRLGDRLQIVSGKRFYEVKKRKIVGKPRAFRFYELV